MRIIIEFHDDNAGFDPEAGGDYGAEVEHVMAQARTWLRFGPREAGEVRLVRDINGNTIGRIEVRP